MDIKTKLNQSHSIKKLERQNKAVTLGSLLKISLVTLATMAVTQSSTVMAHAPQE